MYSIVYICIPPNYFQSCLNYSQKVLHLHLRIPISSCMYNTIQYNPSSSYQSFHPISSHFIPFQLTLTHLRPNPSSPPQSKSKQSKAKPTIN